jgi:hypothetical protein
MYLVWIYGLSSSYSSNLPSNSPWFIFHSMLIWECSRLTVLQLHSPKLHNKFTSFIDAHSEHFVAWQWLSFVFKSFVFPCLTCRCIVQVDASDKTSETVCVCVFVCVYHDEYSEILLTYSESTFIQDDILMFRFSICWSSWNYVLLTFKHEVYFPRC